MYYLLRRIGYAIPVLIGVNLITFILFFMVNSPDDMARMQIGGKYTSKVAIQNWKVQNGYNYPYFYNEKLPGIDSVTHTLFYKKSMSLFTFQFGLSNQGRDISQDIFVRMRPSLALAIPTLVFGLTINILVALFTALFQNSFFDRAVRLACIALISISSLFFIFLGQLLVGKIFQWVPISGYQSGLSAFKFLLLPMLIGILASMGSGIRWYRTIFLEEMGRDYVRTAQSKGLSDFTILIRHVLENGLIPILTGVVVIIPSLFLGSLIMESFFGIPGLGSYTLDAIQQQDFEIVRVMVFLGTLFYILGLLLTDLSYLWVDPRVRLGDAS